MQAKIALALLLVLPTGLLGFACESGRLTPSEAAATAEIVTATAEVRLANIQATIDARQATASTDATRSAKNPPTPAPARVPANTQPSQSQLNRWTREFVDINYWFTVNVEATQLCVLLGDIDWDDYDHRLADISRSFTSIGVDAADDSLDSYSVAEVESVISDAKRLIREIGRKCDIPVN